jgi:hypothetical protein
MLLLFLAQPKENLEVRIARLQDDEGSCKVAIMTP